MHDGGRILSSKCSNFKVGETLKLKRNFQVQQDLHSYNSKSFIKFEDPNVNLYIFIINLRTWGPTISSTCTSIVSI